MHKLFLAACAAGVFALSGSVYAGTATTPATSAVTTAPTQLTDAQMKKVTAGGVVFINYGQFLKGNFCSQYAPGNAYGIPNGGGFSTMPCGE